MIHYVLLIRHQKVCIEIQNDQLYKRSCLKLTNKNDNTSQYIQCFPMNFIRFKTY